MDVADVVQSGESTQEKPEKHPWEKPRENRVDRERQLRHSVKNEMAKTRVHSRSALRLKVQCPLAKTYCSYGHGDQHACEISYGQDVT